MQQERNQLRRLIQLIGFPCAAPAIPLHGLKPGRTLVLTSSLPRPTR
jgi:hypothetical protein